MSITPPANIGLFPPVTMKPSGVNVAAAVSALGYSDIATDGFTLETLTITPAHALWLNIAAVPIPLIPAVPGKIIWPWFWWVEVRTSTAGGATTPSTASLCYSGFTAQPISGSIGVNQNLADRYIFRGNDGCGGGFPSIIVNPFDPNALVNTAVVIFGNNMVGGSGPPASTYRVSVIYSLRNPPSL